MSYTQRYSKTITVTGTVHGSVSYPASQNGGSVSFSRDYSKDVPINVNINVDTNPFENSVNYCNNNVNMLTGAVVATEAAEIQSKRANSIQIGNAVVAGFFNLIGSDLNVQINELTQKANALLLELRGLSDACVKKKRQMEADYNRISKRYVKVFEDLNNELQNRILEMDKPTFHFKKCTDAPKLRRSDTDLINTVTIFGKESGELLSRLSTSATKKRALSALNKSRLFLLHQKTLDRIIEQRVYSETTEGHFYMPACYFQTSDEGNTINVSIYTSNQIPMMANMESKKKLVELFRSKAVKWKPISEDGKNNITMFFETEMTKRITEDTPHSRRVKDMIRQLSDNSKIAAPNING